MNMSSAAGFLEMTYYLINEPNLWWAFFSVVSITQGILIVDLIARNCARGIFWAQLPYPNPPITPRPFDSALRRRAFCNTIF